MIQSTRSHEVDMIRLVSLVGICIVNIPFMATASETIFSPAIGTANQVTTFIIEGLFQLKFFILFSFLFGWGFTVQQQSALANDRSFSRSYLRRMLALMMLGSLHAIFIFSGDILVLYSLVGFVLWLIRDWSVKSLMYFAGSMLPISMVSLTVLIILADTAMVPTNADVVVSLAGNYVATTAVRLADWPATLSLLIFLQGPIVLAAFAAGLAAGKSQFFDENSTSFKKLTKAVPWLLIIALPINLLYALIMGGFIDESNELLILLGLVAIAIGAPALASVYLVSLVKLARRFSLPTVFILAGQNSLSVYVLQGVIAGFVFGGYGLGWFNQFGQTGLSLIALIIALLAILAVGLFAMLFGRGPLEPVLRKISYS